MLALMSGGYHREEHTVSKVDIAPNLGSDFLQDFTHFEVRLGGLGATTKFGSLFELFLRFKLSLSKDSPWC